MSWPLSQDYNEAIQDPRSCFSDPELRVGEATVNALGMPIPRSGNFADVYEFNSSTSSSKWAIKCFTRQVAGLRERYSEISRYLQAHRLPFGVDFQFLEQGIRVRGQWYPILKMRWVEGLLLNEFVRDNLDKPALLGQLSVIWGRMARRLREAGIAHCDLQHGNVILVPGSKTASLAVKLIDYDGMFVPALARTKTGEVGHPNYQHPQRLREGIYNAEVDRFPLLVVATALQALSVGGRDLWERYDNGDNLLFKESDLRSPEQSALSPLFKELLALPDPQTRTLVGTLLRASRGKLEDAPAVDELLPEAKATNVRVSASASAAGKSSGPPPLPDVLDFGDADSSPRKRKQAARKGGVAIGGWLIAASVVAAVALSGFLLAFSLGRDGQPKDKSAVVTNKPDNQVEKDIPKDDDPKPPDKPPVRDLETPAKEKPPENPKPVLEPLEEAPPLPVMPQYTALFNGRDLMGWKEMADAKSSWKVVNGVLTGTSGTGPDADFSILTTQRQDYSDFDLQCELLASEGQGSGVFVRGLEAGYGVGIAGARTSPAEKFLGSLYRPVDGTYFGEKLAAPPTPFSSPVPGRRLTLTVNARGPHLKIYINGRFNSEYVDEISSSMTGPICLVVRPSSTMRVRKIQIRELPALPPMPVTTPPEDKPFVSLFSGKDLAGWTVDGGTATHWAADGETIVGNSASQTTRTYLLTNKEYADFILKFEYKVESGHHGVALRAVAGEKLPIANTVLSDHPLIKLSDANAKETTGTSYWLKSAETYVPPTQVLKQAAGEWQKMEVTVRGDRCMAVIEGNEVVNLTFDPDGKKAESFTPALKRAKGKVGFQTNTGTLRLRKIEIKELAAATSDTTVTPMSPDQTPEKPATGVKKLRQTYELAIKKANEKLLAAFDPAVEAAGKLKLDPESRVELQKVVKAEKEAFETSGRIPFSSPMRPATTKYLEQVALARAQFTRDVDRSIDYWMKRKDADKVQEFTVEKDEALQPTVMAVWKYGAGSNPTREIQLLSNGKVMPGGTGTWSMTKAGVTMLFPNNVTKEKMWIDILITSVTGKSMEGQNQQGRKLSGKLVE